MTIFSLRPATEADYDYCYTVTKENMLALFSKHWGGWSDAGFREGFDAARVSMILVNAAPVGYLSVEMQAGAVFVDNLQVAVGYQGRGIGSAVLLGLADSDSSKALRLSTFADNRARELYERLGFVVMTQESEMLHMERPAKLAP